MSAKQKTAVPAITIGISLPVALFLPVSVSARYRVTDRGIHSINKLDPIVEKHHK